MRPSELKKRYEENNRPAMYFCRENMRGAGDTMSNYGVMASTVVDMYGKEREVWCLYRKFPVKYGVQTPTFFDKGSFRIVRTRENYE